MKIVLIGGCFDLLHPGHLHFLTQAKKLGDKLVVLLESDARVKKLKGQDRPINSQEKRAAALRSLRLADEIINLPNTPDFPEIIKKIGPKAIAVTAGDENLSKKQNAASIYNIPVVKIPLLPGFSTTKILEKML